MKKLLQILKENVGAYKFVAYVDTLEGAGLGGVVSATFTDSKHIQLILSGRNAKVVSPIDQNQNCVINVDGVDVPMSEVSVKSINEFFKIARAANRYRVVDPRGTKNEFVSPKHPTKIGHTGRANESILLSQIIKEGQWDKPLGLSHDVESFKKRGQDFMDPVSKRKFEAAAETVQDPQSREQLFSLGTRFIHRALARNPNLTPPEIQQLLSLNDPDISESLEELYGEQSEQVTEANQDMGKVVFDQQTSVIADYLTQRVPEPEIINILVKKHKMDPQRAEVLLQSAKNMIRSGH